MKDRVFDYVEATLIPDARKQLEALRSRGSPGGLVTADLMKRIEADAVYEQSGDQVKGSDLTYVLDRLQSEYDVDESSDESYRLIIVRPVYTSCRDGWVVNDPIVDTNDPTSDPYVLASSWIIDKDGVWRVTE